MTISFEVDSIIKTGFFFEKRYHVGKFKYPDEKEEVYIDDSYNVRRFGRFTSNKDPCESYRRIEQQIFAIGREMSEDVMKFQERVTENLSFDIEELKTNETPLTWMKVKLINKAITDALLNDSIKG